MQFKRSTRRKVQANVDLTPLIDVVFQLIIFFMLSSTFVVQSSIPIEIPVTDSQPPQLERKDLTIQLAVGDGGPEGDGRVVVTQEDEVEIHSWDELTTVLSLFQERTAQLREMGQEEPLVLIQADQQVSMQRLVHVLGIANSVGIEHYGIAADSLGERL